MTATQDALQERKEQARADALDAAVRLAHHRASVTSADEAQPDVIAAAREFYEFLMSDIPTPNEFEPPFVYRGEDGEWRWHQKSANHEVVADSGEGHPFDDGKAHCIDMARRQTGHEPVVIED